MTAALDYLSVKITAKIAGEARMNRTGQEALKAPISFTAPTITLGTAAGAAVLGGGNLAAGLILTLPLSGVGSYDIDLSTIVDVANRSAQAFVRIKSWFFWLLSAGQTFQGVTGNACSSVAIGPHSSNGHGLNLTGTTPAFVLESGDYQLFGGNQAAGKVVDGTHKVIKCLSGDAAIAGKLVACVIGSQA